MPYDWAGTRILQKNTVLQDKRRVFENIDTLVPTDLREWVTPGDREEIRRALDQMDLPPNRIPGTFDKRAKTVWKWVIDHIEYTEDPKKQKLLDYWQFPAETIAVRQGDCEDCAFLLASLLLGSGISSYCVRVVIGTLEKKESVCSPHAWTVYKDETGRWCLLEATHDKGTSTEDLPSAESLASEYSGHPIYTPIICLNSEHVWQVGRQKGLRETEAFLADFQNRNKKHRVL